MKTTMDILCRKADGILTLQFNRPRRKNAITSAMYQNMADALKDGEQDAAVRVVLIVGAPEIFTSGNDLEDFMKTSTPAGRAAFASRLFAFMQQLQGATKPVMAAVSGAAIGIGTTMLLHCDLVYAADNAKFSMPFVQLGLCPEFASSLLFVQMAGYPRAAEKLMLGEPFMAEEALQMGLVSKVLPQDELIPFALRQAAKLVALPAASLRATKRLMKSGRVAPVNAAMLEENLVFASLLAAPEAKEAFAAFFDKRKPDFSKFA